MATDDTRSKIIELPPGTIAVTKKYLVEAADVLLKKRNDELEALSNVVSSYPERGENWSLKSPYLQTKQLTVVELKREERLVLGVGVADYRKSVDFWERKINPLAPGSIAERGVRLWNLVRHPKRTALIKNLIRDTTRHDTTKFQALAHHYEAAVSAEALLDIDQKRKADGTSEIARLEAFKNTVEAHSREKFIFYRDHVTTFEKDLKARLARQAVAYGHLRAEPADLHQGLRDRTRPHDLGIDLRNLTYNATPERQEFFKAETVAHNQELRARAKNDAEAAEDARLAETSRFRKLYKGEEGPELLRFIHKHKFDRDFVQADIDATNKFLEVSGLKMRLKSVPGMPILTKVI